jgi:hypothetical protein
MIAVSDQHASLLFRVIFPMWIPSVLGRWILTIGVETELGGVGVGEHGL